ncbi:hypothetical protein GOV09_03550 [Candidatus Woesearchaeota archaeon]|nr:hypothetical protein [Candidatus Woesearchaeota archaeon]
MRIKKEEIEEKIDELKDKFQELQQSVSVLRKEGKDTAIAELMVLDIPSKIKTASLTQEEHDIKRAKHLLKDIKNEIDDLSKGSDFDRINVLIKECFEHLRNNEKKPAKDNYHEIMQRYRLLPKELKQTVFSACKGLRERLE